VRAEDYINPGVDFQAVGTASGSGVCLKVLATNCEALATARGTDWRFNGGHTAPSPARILS
jgi:hypothetical protein